LGAKSAFVVATVLQNTSRSTGLGCPVNGCESDDRRVGRRRRTCRSRGSKKTAAEKRRRSTRGTV